MLKFLTVLLLTFLNTAQAGIIQKVGSCAMALLEKPYKAAMVNYKDRDMLLHTRDGSSFLMLLGKRFGDGVFGSVYEVLEINGIPQLENLPFKLGVKIPHALKGTSSPLFYTDASTKSEWDNYQYLVKRVPKIQKDKNFPENPGWLRDALPVVPIVAKIQTEIGTLLFKPIIKGVDIKGMAKIYREDKKKFKEIEASLKDVYQTIQAIHSQVKVKEEGISLAQLIGRGGYSTDIRPPNFVYVDDEKSMSVLELNRPSVILWEIDKVPYNYPNYIAEDGKMEEAFRSYIDDEYVSYLELEETPEKNKAAAQ
jgi:hypothetical protein